MNPELQHLKGDLFKLFFLNSQDGQYVVDWTTEEFLMVNPVFCQMFGYSQQQAESGLKVHDVISKFSNQDDYSDRREKREKYKPERYRMTMPKPNGTRMTVEFVVTLIEYDGHELLIGSVRDMTHQFELEEKIKAEKIKFQQASIETGKAVIRIAQLTEKIKNIPTLIGSLLQYTDEDELLQATADLLCSPYGMNYKDVHFYLHKSGRLQLRYSTGGGQDGDIDRESDHLIARVYRGEEVEGSGEYIIVPIKSRRQTKGVLQVFIDRSERVLFDQDNSVREGQTGIVRTLGNVTGLLISNIRLYNKVHQQSVSDPLTGLHNRRYFESKLKEEVERSLRYNRNLALMFLDVDGLKAVNDHHGHLQGDIMLKEVALILKASFRAIDTVCRLAGDEFVVIMPETSLRNAAAVGEKIRRQVEQMELMPGMSDSKVRVTLSIGLAGTSGDNDTWDKLLHSADEAVYQSKRNGRNQVTMQIAPSTFASP